MKSTLVFVYNAQSGLFNALADIGHKIFSPQTYSCQLCALTHSYFGMHKEWRRFVESLDRPLEFLHADELESRDGSEKLLPPAILERRDGQLKTLVDAAAINACRNMGDLKRLLVSKLP